jgi:hypothetical protein
VFSDFKRVIYVDRLPPVSALDSFKQAGGAAEAVIRSTDLTADRIHVFENLPAGTTDEAVAQMAAEGKGRCDRIDRALFRRRIGGLAAGSHNLTIATFENTGTRSIQRVQVQLQ